MSQTASYTAIPVAIGNTSFRGDTIVGSHTPQLNDASHVTRDPDQGRITMRRPDGSTYTTVPSISQAAASTMTPIILIKEA